MESPFFQHHGKNHVKLILWSVEHTYFLEPDTVTGIRTFGPAWSQSVMSCGTSRRLCPSRGAGLVTTVHLKHPRSILEPKGLDKTFSSTLEASIYLSIYLLIYSFIYLVMRSFC